MIQFQAEWEPQSAVMIAWPHPSGDFGLQLEAVEKTFHNIAKAISRFQTLVIVCRDLTHQKQIEPLMQNIPCRYIHTTYDDIWLRDTAPLSIKTKSGFQLLNFRFNGWGEKYTWQADHALNRNLYNSGIFGVTPIKEIDMVLEGGSIETDGEGTLLTTRQCLLNPNRNPELTEQGIENNLKRHLGVKRILWLDQNHLSGDDTDAHIDTLARFCSPGCIAFSTCNNLHDPQYDGLKNMEAQLMDFTTVSGKKYSLIPLPLPKPAFGKDGERLPANYANFLIINHAVLTPVYNDPMDQVVLRRLSTCFPDREIIPIDCTSLIHQYGSLHCMTMQFPESIIDSKHIKNKMQNEEGGQSRLVQNQ